MLSSRIVPVFLLVALAHAALIDAFLTAAPTQAPSRLRSAAIVARLLEPQSGQASAVATVERPPPKPPTAAVHTGLQADAHVTRPSHVPTPAPSTAAPRTLARRSMRPAPVAPSQPTQPPTAARTDPTLAAASSAHSNAVSAAAPVTHETIAIAAPKHVEHADCRIAKPIYPELSKRRGEAGTASVRFVIGTTGAIDTITLVKSSGFARLDDAALQALRASTCEPYLEHGAPVRASYLQAFTFGFDGE